MSPLGDMEPMVWCCHLTTWLAVRSVATRGHRGRKSGLATRRDGGRKSDLTTRQDGVMGGACLTVKGRQLSVVSQSLCDD